MKELTDGCDHGVESGEVTRELIEKAHRQGKVWVSSHDTEMVTRILVIAHFGLASHRSNAAMEKDLKHRFVIQILNNMVSDFTKQCFGVRRGQGTFVYGRCRLLGFRTCRCRDLLVHKGTCVVMAKHLNRILKSSKAT